MANAVELAGKIAAVKESVTELSGRFASSKGQAEQMAANLGAMGVDGEAQKFQAVVGICEEAESGRVVLEGGLAKAHWQVMSAVHGTMGPGAYGTGPGGRIVPQTQAGGADGGPPPGGLDAIPPHLRQDPTPTGEELLQPIDRKRGSNLFTEAVSKGDQVEDAAKTFGKQFEAAWRAFHSEPSPASAQENAVSETQSSHGPVFTAPPAPQVGAGGAIMGAFVASVVATKATQHTVRQFERFHNWVRKAEDRGEQKPR